MERPTYHINKIKINESLYLSVNVFSMAVLIEDTVNSETNTLNQTETCHIRFCYLKEATF